jgi:hypothetical protein
MRIMMTRLAGTQTKQKEERPGPRKRVEFCRNLFGEGRGGVCTQQLTQKARLELGRSVSLGVWRVVARAQLD